MNGGRSHSLLEVVFRDIQIRRTALIKAFTTDFDEFYQQCDPGKGQLCLFGHSNGKWEITLPSEEVPPDFPEPVIGFNLSRDALDANDWLCLVAVHSDTWLLALAFYNAASFGFDKAHRERLFDMINSSPTLLEIVNLENSKKSKSKRGKKKCEGKASIDGIVNRLKELKVKPYKEEPCLSTLSKRRSSHTAKDVRDLTVVRDVNCCDLASDPMVGVSRGCTLSQASPSTR